MTPLPTLKARLEETTGPDRALDIEIGRLWPEPRPFNLTDQSKRNAMPVCPRFTASVDAALELVERMLPEWQFINITTLWTGPRKTEETSKAKAHFRRTVASYVWVEAEAKTAPLAILIALVSALEKQKS